MTFEVLARGGLRQDAERLEYAREIVRAEAAALQQVADRLDDSFLQAVDLIYRSPGRVCITGTGKSADVGQKIAGTLNSTGTRAYALDSTRAVHGDLGMVHHDDVVVALSHSGESEEIIRLLPSLKQMARAVIGITSNSQSTLAHEAGVALVLGPLEEVCPLGLAPRTVQEVLSTYHIPWSTLDDEVCCVAESVTVGGVDGLAYRVLVHQIPAHTA